MNEKVKQVYMQFPAVIRSSRWPEISALAAAGNVEGAKRTAREVETRNLHMRAENIVARRLRQQRLALFILQKRAEEQLGAIFKTAQDSMTERIDAKSLSPSAIPKLRVTIHDASVQMRGQLRKWVTDHIWFAARLGLRNMGDALQPIFDENKDHFAEELREQALLEDQLSVGMATNFKGVAAVSLADAKWKKTLDRIYRRIVQTNANGLTPSERVWDLTRQTEARLKAIVVNGIARGTASRRISNDLKKYLSPAILGGDGDLGPGVYKSPFKNAMRLVRTETSRAYTSASAEWAAGKDWVAGMRVVLSPSHIGPDECDDIAEKGELLTPDEISDLLPIHPHCVCQATPVIKPEFLAQREE